MRRPKTLGYVHCSVQFVAGCVYGRAAHASTLEPADEKSEEDRTDIDLRDGDRVRTTPNGSQIQVEMPPETDTHHPSICALTLYRIYITTTISTTNQSSVYPTIYLLTCLEALLGVINACLPVLKPVYDKAKRTISSSYALLSSGGKIKKGGGSSGGDSATVDVFASPGVRRVAAARRGSTEKILESLDEERMFDMDKTLPASPQVTQVEVVHARGERDIESGVTVGESRLREASEEKRGWW